MHAPPETDLFAAEDDLERELDDDRSKDAMYAIGITWREIGPVDGPNGVTYLYRIDGRISEFNYHNAGSALHDARRPQRINANGRWEPIPDPDDERHIVRSVN